MGGHLLEKFEQKPRKSDTISIDKKQILRSWLLKNVDNPYPSEERILQFSHETGLNTNQIKTWFSNARRKDRFESLTKPDKPKVF